MVSMKEVRRSNDGLKNRPAGMKAVFIGATAGIGASTVKQFALHTNAPTVYLVGRSQTKAAPLLVELKSLNPQATFTFIEAEVSLLKAVDEVCDEILAKEQKLDLLWLSQGLLSFAGQQKTSEGIPLLLAVPYYSRMRFISNFLPLLSKSSSPRVDTLLAAGRETNIDTSDFELSSPDNYSLQNATNHTATMTTLALDELSESNPKITFIHKYPGIVKTGLLGKMFDDWKGAWRVLGFLAQKVLLPAMSLFQVSAEEAGERGLYTATSDKFSGGGFYRLDWNDEKAREVPQLDKYRAEGMPKKVWEHTVGVFDRVMSSG